MRNKGKTTAEGGDGMKKKHVYNRLICMGLFLLQPGLNAVWAA